MLAAATEVMPLRYCLSQDETESVVFACDVLSQPHYRKAVKKTDHTVHLKCSRALPVAEEQDVVVLSGALDREYHAWLRTLGFSTDHVVEYGHPTAFEPLSQTIKRDPKPVLETISKAGGKPVYVPFYSGAAETEAAKLLEADLFGCEEEIGLKYFNKESFKAECIKLGIPMVNGSTHSVHGMLDKDFALLVSNLLKTYPSVIVRGSLGSAGSSAFFINNPDVSEVLRQIKDSNDSEVLVEPFLKVIASPNDQWAIGRGGEIWHLGTSAQLFEGLKHVGNIQGRYFSARVSNYVLETSSKIVGSMAAHGYRGILGIDYIVTEEGIYPIENNARMNGSSFTLAIIDRLNQQQEGTIRNWKFYKAQTTPCSYLELVRRIEPLIYDGTNINAVFPYDCDALSTSGVFTPVVVAEDTYHLDFMIQALEELGIRAI